MATILRGLGIAMAVGLVWTAAAGRAAAASRLPVDDVVRGAVLTQAFGCTTLGVEPFDPYCPSRHFHSGVDLAAPAGTPVYAATGGRASTAFDASGCGLFVSVAYDDHVRVLYCHLQSAAVSGPTVVSSGELVGRVGSSGLTTGSHLHLEVDIDGRAIDPVRWLAES
jgi:murein DD-endopeptidase MepM/ murein hydrolase activator NlpD